MADGFCRFSQNEILIMSEALKTLFNLSVSLCEEDVKEGADFVLFNKLSLILHCLLSKCAPLPEQPEILIGHIAHMLVNIPMVCLNGLIPSVKRRQWQDAVPNREGYPTQYEVGFVFLMVSDIFVFSHSVTCGNVLEGILYSP